MKRCPQCRRDYYDDSLFYCLDDGNALLEGPATKEAETVLLPVDEPPQGLHRTFRTTRAVGTGFRSEGSLKGLRHETDSPLIGRVKETAEIKRLLESEDIRLVTLTGIGGTGKTRLSIEIAHQLQQYFSDGIYFIDLSAVNDPLLVIPKIAHAVGVKEVPSKKALEVLTSHLFERSVLLILDNFEQIVSAGVQLTRLLTETRDLKILVTSRETLKLSFETEYQIPPFTLPSADGRESAAKLMDYEAVQFFVQRARRARPDYELTDDDAQAVSAICNTLEGLPLALELAAARAKILSASEILAKLADPLKLLTGGSRDLPERQQTMVAAIEWSYDLLNDSEKSVFQMLSVFEGGFAITAAEALISDSESQMKFPHAGVDVIDVIESLTAKSLVMSERPSKGTLRFRMLEIVRSYAAERLAASGRAEIVQRSHAKYFLGLAEEAAPLLVSSKAAEWLDRLEIDNDNLRGAMRWSLVNEPEIGARIAASIRYLWTVRGPIREGQHWLEEILGTTAELQPDLRWELLVSLGNMLQFQGDLVSARNAYAESLEISRASANRRQTAQSLRGIGAIEYMQSDFASARERINESYSISRELDDDFGAGASAARLGDISIAEGNPQAARSQTGEALALFRKLGYNQGIASKLINLASAEILCGDYLSAHVHLVESLNLSLEIGDEKDLQLVLEGFGAYMLNEGDYWNAALLSGAAERLGETNEKVWEPAEQRLHDFYLEKLREVMDKNDFTRAFSQGRKMPVREAAAIALRVER